jgi:hypothetical protein
MDICHRSYWFVSGDNFHGLWPCLDETEEIIGEGDVGEAMFRFRTCIGDELYQPSLVSTSRPLSLSYSSLSMSNLLATS